MDCPPGPSSSPTHWSRYLIASSVLAAMGGHVLMTLVYLSPPNIAREHLGATADAYIKPLFNQNWHLFSPNPGVTTRKFALRCGEGGTWSDWFDPLEGLIAEHNANRLSGIGKLLYVYRAIGDDLRRRVEKRIVACRDRVEEADDGAPSTEDESQNLPLSGLHGEATECAPEALMDGLTRTAEFHLAVRYGAQVCGALADENGTGFDALQFKLLEFFPLKYADRESAEAEGRHWDKVYETVFPIVTEQE